MGEIFKILFGLLADRFVSQKIDSQHFYLCLPISISLQAIIITNRRKKITHSAPGGIFLSKICFLSAGKPWGGTTQTITKCTWKVKKLKAEATLFLVKGVLFKKWCKSDLFCYFALPRPKRLAMSWIKLKEASVFMYMLSVFAFTLFSPYEFAHSF